MLNRDPQQSAMACGCDPAEKHRCLACTSIGGYYGCSLKVDLNPGGGSSGMGSGGSAPPIEAPRHTTPGASKKKGHGLFPDSAQSRKDHPVFTGVLMYFPDAIAAVSNVSKVGNDQHNPGQPLHWARSKSTDQMDTATRHMMDHGVGDTKDSDGMYHLAKAAWRTLAELQLTIEKEREGR